MNITNVIFKHFALKLHHMRLLVSHILHWKLHHRRLYWFNKFCIERYIMQDCIGFTNFALKVTSRKIVLQYNLINISDDKDSNFYIKIKSKLNIWYEMDIANIIFKHFALKLHHMRLLVSHILHWKLHHRRLYWFNKFCIESYIT